MGAFILPRVIAFFLAARWNRQAEAKRRPLLAIVL